MHRRNFFKLAGAVTALIGANGAATADTFPKTKQTLLEVAEQYKGSSLDSDLVTIAVQTATTIKPQDFVKGEQDVFCGKWFIYKHTQISGKLNVISATQAFGSGFASMTMSEMVETVANSQYGTPNMTIVVDRDGQFNIGY
jgi:hypothetical protein